MTRRTSEHLILAGFAMAYLGAMGLLLMLSSVNLSEDALAVIRLTLAASFVLGSVSTLIGRLAPLRPDHPGERGQRLGTAARDSHS